MNRSFVSLDAFVAHLEQLRIRERAADIAGRRAVVETISHLARERLGKPSFFTPLAKSTMAERSRLGYAANQPLIRTGALRESISWAHLDSRESGVGSSSPYAVYHELGGKVPGRPPQRSFLAATAHDKEKTLFGLYATTYREVLNL